MKTTRQKKEEFIARGSEIQAELYKMFPRESEIIIADIGACDGLSSIIYANMFPNARVLVFEPLTQNKDEAVANLEEFKVLERCSVYQVALSDKDGAATMHVSSGEAPGVTDWETGNKSSSLLRPHKHIQEHKWCKFEKTEQVQVMKLDNFMHFVGRIPKIDFAHIDVQGAELQVMRGGKETFRRTKAFWMEVANIDLYAGQPLKTNIARYMQNAGLTCQKDTCGRNKTGDMLWVRR